MSHSGNFPFASFEMCDQGSTGGELQVWMESIAKKLNLVDFTVNTQGNTEKGDGYLGEVVFLTLSGTTAENAQKKVFNFVVKHGKNSATLRKATNIREIFLNEIAVYENLFPAFQEFQRKRNVIKIFDSYPKCYGSLVYSSMEVLVLDNVHMLGYNMHDRMKTMDLNHVELVLKQYGTFHGLSLAMRDQDEESFSQICRSVKNPFSGGNSATLENLKGMLSKTADLLRSRNYGHVADKIEKLIPVLSDICKKVREYDGTDTVMLHGDCWNNNFMFSYMGDEIEKPETMCILDWQISHVGPPVLDLSHFLFLCCESELLKDIEKLLRIYYKALSKCLIEVGSDPEKIFPFSKLTEQWKKFSIYSIIIAPLLMKTVVVDKDEAPDISANTENNGDIFDSFKLPIKNIEEYNSRLLELMTNPTVVDCISCEYLL